MSSYFDKLFVDNYKKLVSISYRYIKSKSIAEDIVQDVFVDFWRRLEKKQNILNHEAYLNRATVLRSLETIKKEKRYKPEDDSALELLLRKTDTENDISYYSSQETKTKLKAAIINLPDRTQEVFMLSKYDNYTHNEISEVLEISKKTVEYHITKALLLLRKALICLVLWVF